MTKEGVPMNDGNYAKYKDYYDKPLVVQTTGLGLVNSYMQKMKSSAQIEKLTVCIVGSGNWGSTAAKIIGENIQEGAAKQFFDQ
jgi:hypothetical protein